MTDKELIAAGWKQKMCKIGYLYFKEDYFCRLDKDEAIVFSVSDDMNPLGKAKTFEEIKKLQKENEEHEIIATEFMLKTMRETFEKKYGVPAKTLKTLGQ